MQAEPKEMEREIVPTEGSVHLLSPQRTCGKMNRIRKGE